MKVLLLYDVDRLGKQGETVEVRDGFARNYLLPKRLAVTPIGKASKQLDLVKRKQKKLEQKLVSEAGEVKKTIDAIGEIGVEVRANEQGHLYGSVTPSMIIDALRDYKVKIDSKQVELPKNIRETGDYQVKIAIYKDLVSTLKLKITASAEVKVEEPKHKRTEGVAPTGTSTPTP